MKITIIDNWSHDNKFEWTSSPDWEKYSGIGCISASHAVSYQQVSASIDFVLLCDLIILQDQICPTIHILSLRRKLRSRPESLFTVQLQKMYLPFFLAKKKKKTPATSRLDTCLLLGWDSFLLPLQRPVKHAWTLSTLWLDHPEKAADCRVDAGVFACFDKRPSSQSQPLACVSPPRPPPTVKVLKIFCQTHSFDNNLAESRSSPKVHAAPGVAAEPLPPSPPRLCQKTGWTKRTFFPFLTTFLHHVPSQLFLSVPIMCLICRSVRWLKVARAGCFSCAPMEIFWGNSASRERFPKWP